MRRGPARTRTVCHICGKKEFARKLCQSHWYRWRTYGDPNHKINHSQEAGYEGERNVAVLLRAYGRDASVVRGNKPFDLLVDGWRVEVKTAHPHKAEPRRLEWSFSIARNGVLNERTDFYVLRFEKVPFSDWALHALLRAPIGRPCVTVSMLGLVGQKYHQEVEDFWSLAKGEYGRKEIAA